MVPGLTLGRGMLFLPGLGAGPGTAAGTAFMAAKQGEAEGPAVQMP